MNKAKLSRLTKEQLIDVILELCEKRILKWELIENVIDKQLKNITETIQIIPKTKMSDEFLLENMKKANDIFAQIEDQELVITANWYEDYSQGYWNSEEVWEYEDIYGVSDELIFIINLAKTCINDCRYKEALSLYDRLIEIEIFVDDEMDGDLIGLEGLVSENLLKTDLKSICLETLFCSYQTSAKEERIKNIRSYFNNVLFYEIHVQDMFQVGYQQLEDEDNFWNEWIQFLLADESDEGSRLLKEALEFCCDEKMISEFAEKYYNNHPALYLYAMEENLKRKDYKKALQLGKDAMEKLNHRLRIRSEIAARAAEIAEYINNTEEKYYFQYETFRSNSNVKNLIILFENKDAAEKYTLKCKTLLSNIYPNSSTYDKNTYKEKAYQHISNYTYYSLLFLMGDFMEVKEQCKNTANSLGWSSCFIKKGLKLFLLYLYDGKNIKTDAAAWNINSYLANSANMENDIFFNLFCKWKEYYPMEKSEKESIYKWAEEIIKKRVDAIVRGQHRGKYGDVAILLGVLAEIQEAWGAKGVKQDFRQEYKQKYPRHTAFQKELNMYLGNLK